ncbi:hypothetical protein ACFVHI_31215 [Kitasatospora sp. NPDC127121]|uniref:hypothetical protein n=1 Tax=unclassified Kitasatospora TaxID=2633591 RepID=UPI0036333288
MKVLTASSKFTGSRLGIHVVNGAVVAASFGTVPLGNASFGDRRLDAGSRDNQRYPMTGESRAPP